MTRNPTVSPVYCLVQYTNIAPGQLYQTRSLLSANYKTEGLYTEHAIRIQEQYLYMQAF
jgi:hypothetical protein